MTSPGLMSIGLSQPLFLKMVCAVYLMVPLDIKPGDVIVRFNGEILENPNSLQRSLASLKAGTRVQLGVVRDGREYPPVPVDVADLPDP